MTIVFSLTELKRRMGMVLSKAVVEGQDVVIERYGQAYAVILSQARYQALLDAAQARVRERLLDAQQAVYQATADIPEDEVEAIVETAVKASRRERGK